MRLFMFELLSPFGDILDRCNLAELLSAHQFDPDTAYAIARVQPGESIDLPEFEGAVMLRRVS